MTRTGIILTTSAAVVGVTLTAFIDMPKKLIWNASASTPIGLYAITPVDTFGVGDLVAVNPPETLAHFLAERHYLPRGVPLLKHIAALPEQRVCRIGRRVIVDGVAVGQARERDRLGRSLPDWQGCRRIADDEVFLMNETVRDSLDGRYFGPMPSSSIIGRAHPLWTENKSSGRFTWRANRAAAFSSTTQPLTQESTP